MIPLLRDGLKVAGPICFIGLQMSSVQTASRIYSSGSVGDFSAVPFLALLINGLIWTYYGILKKDLTVLVPNACSIFAGFGCVATYQMFSKEAHFFLYAVSLILIAAATIMAYLGNDQLLGSLGCILAMVLMGSPLATLNIVLTIRSTESLSFFTSLMTWLNSLSWALYGALVANDAMIYGPNLIGLLLGTLQLALFAAFGFGVPKTNDSKIAYQKSLF